ncbi:YIP1 family protein [Culicoidibacter larvae]|uniref:Yip1 domain-containing protein n=1 Tax=Culicoidibacter larvae TaxID=2579976 RepID=A0A5R8QE31_9FIRM|nr:YIP1 family protein [Culicoidibacter larvae]TLG74253.1 hypothetical protein FEZ08_05980 [Culicoidibacter larvae]
MSLLWTLLSSPAKAFQQIGAEKKTKGFLAILLAWVLVAALGMVTVPAVVAESMTLVENQVQGMDMSSLMPMMVVTTIIFALIGMVLGIFLLACLYLFLAFIFRDRVEGTAITFKKALQLAFIVNLPAQLGAALYSIVIYSIAIPGLPQVILQYLNPFYLITFIWLFFAAKYTMKLTQAKALIVVAIAVAIHFAFAGYQIYSTVNYTVPTVEQSININI